MTIHLGIVERSFHVFNFHGCRFVPCTFRKQAATDGTNGSRYWWLYRLALFDSGPEFLATFTEFIVREMFFFPTLGPEFQKFNNLLTFASLCIFRPSWIFFTMYSMSENLDLFKVFFSFYHGKSLNHHLGEFFVFFPGIERAHPRKRNPGWLNKWDNTSAVALWFRMKMVFLDLCGKRRQSRPEMTIGKQWRV